MNNCEERLREAYCKYQLATQTKYIFKEIPVFSRSVDLVECDCNWESITAIEFKISDWKRAIEQLLQVAPCFDYLVLCFPKPKTDKCLHNIEEKCSKLGIGLVVWHSDKDEFTSVCLPEKAKTLWCAQKNSVISYLKQQR